MTEGFLPFAKPDIGQAEIDEVVASLASGWLTTGPRVEGFEAALSNLLTGRHVAAVGSGTAALHLALVAAGIGAGDEVITPDLTFAAAVNSIIQVGARPVMVDIDSATYNLDVSQVADQVTPATKAILPVHFAGLVAPMDELIAVADEHGIRLIEDAAHAIGATYRGQSIGTFGDIACFSFQAIKNLTCGEGGAVVTGDGEIDERVRRLRFHGITRPRNPLAEGAVQPYDVLEPGFKYNMMDLQAAIGLQQLERLTTFQDKRKRLAAEYTKRLEHIPGVQAAPGADDEGHAWHIYCAVIDEQAPMSRQEVINELHRVGIGTGIHFPAIHQLTFYRQFCPGGAASFPVADRIASGIVSLPLHTAMTIDDVDRVVRALEKIVTGSPSLN